MNTLRIFANHLKSIPQILEKTHTHITFDGKMTSYSWESAGYMDLPLLSHQFSHLSGRSRSPAKALAGGQVPDLRRRVEDAVVGNDVGHHLQLVHLLGRLGGQPA